jgi:hypothetical protein
VLYGHIDLPRVFQPSRASSYAAGNLKGVNAPRSQKFRS